MKNTFIICNTYAQLIMAIQLKNTIKSNENIVVCITDHSRNAEMIADNLRKLDMFYGVVYCPCKKFDYQKRNAVQAIIDSFRIAFGEIYSSILDELGLVFDEVIYYNLNVTAVDIFSCCYKKNTDLLCSKFEEGILSYANTVHDELYSLTTFRRYKAAHKIRSIFNKKNMDDRLKSFYCFYPSFYHGKAVPVQVPFITNDKCGEILAKAFDISRENLNYPQKYVFFASTGDFEGEASVGEVDIAVRVSELVGKENLLIKVHPRDRTDSFAKAGLVVDKNSAIPWEAIQLNYDFRNHVFLTVSSSSVFGVNMMTEDRVKVYFLYKLCNVDGNSFVKNSVDSIERIMNSSDGLDTRNYFIAEKVEDILGGGI